MSAFVNTPEMDWFSAVEHGVEAGSRLAPIGLDTAPGYQIQPQRTSNPTGCDTLLGCQLDTTSISDADVPPTIEFKSGCRVIQYQEPESQRKRPIEDPQGDRFVCLWSPCKSTRTFGRVAELQRHYDEQHVRSKVFDCIAVDCPAKGLRAFTRLSKLSIHLKTNHSKSTPFLCPVMQCSAGPFPADLLHVHMYLHNGYSEGYDYISTIMVGIEYKSLCPVQGCHEKLSVHRHTLDSHHDIDTRKRDESVILAAGYSPTTGRPICPVCNKELAFRSCWTTEAIMQHLWSHHWEFLYSYRREILNVLPCFNEKKTFLRYLEVNMPSLDRKGFVTRVSYSPKLVWIVTDDHSSGGVAFTSELTEREH